jgi:hypothetical protein
MTQISNERLDDRIRALKIWIESGRSSAPDLDRDTLSALTELQALRASSGVEELRVSLDGEKLRKAVDFMLGPSAEGEEYTDATLWVGYAENDEKQKVYGLHLNNSEYPEEGCLTLAELPSPLPTVEVTEEMVERAYADWAASTEAQDWDAGEMQSIFRISLNHLTAALSQKKGE